MSCEIELGERTRTSFVRETFIIAPNLPSDEHVLAKFINESLENANL